MVLVDCELADSNQPVSALPTEDVTSVCMWLLGQMQWILDMHPDIAHDIDSMYRDLQRVVGERSPRDEPCRFCGGEVIGKDNTT